MQKCYYHRHPISYFCIHEKCTLPLCDACFSIHAEEMSPLAKHDEEKHMLKYQVAKEKALNWLSEEEGKFKEIEDKLNKKLEEIQAKLINEITTEFAIIRDQILSTMKLNIELEKMNRKYENVENGSLKELILVYGDIYDESREEISKRQTSLKIIDSINCKIGLEEVREMVQKSMKFTLIKEKKKKGFTLSKVAQSSEVRPYSPNFRKVINTKDMYMKSPRSSMASMSDFQKRAF